MTLQGWAEQNHPKRLSELAQIPEYRKKEQILQWIKDDGIDELKIRKLWGPHMQEADLDIAVIKFATKRMEELTESEKKELTIEPADERKSTNALHRYEYEVVAIDRDGRMDTAVIRNAYEVINKYSAKGWRLHTYSQAGLGAGGFAKGFAGKDMVNVLHLVFERER